MTPVVYSPAAQVIVDDYNSLPKAQKTAAFWSDSTISALKKEVKDHYIAEQAHRCAYCRQPIFTFNNSVWDAEHIISKQKNPEFMFVPQNIAISCKDCNIAKGEQEVRKTAKIAFPTAPHEYKIVHPHFDVYDSHIGWIGPVCFAKSIEKGSNTIAMCNLTRYSAICLSTDDNIMDERFNGLLANLFTAKSEQDGDIILAGIKQFLRGRK